MVTQNNNIFRKKALEKLSSPERLDQVMKVIYPMDWLPLTALGSLIVIGIIWSIVGRIPITVAGQGVLVYPSKVASVQGQIVSPGTPIATVQAEEPGAKLVGLTLFSVGEGQKIRKGMKVQITPTTVERERFGGIVATVTHVSAFPVTKKGAISEIGNAEVVQSLIAKEPQIQVWAELQPDISTFSTYKWSSSKGPQMKVSSGTTASVRVTTEERAPIDFVFPFLKSLTGVN